MSMRWAGILPGLSSETRFEPCLKMHLKKAKEKGFTQSEIDEAAWMGNIVQCH